MNYPEEIAEKIYELVSDMNSEDYSGTKDETISDLVFNRKSAASAG